MTMTLPATVRYVHPSISSPLLSLVDNANNCLTSICYEKGKYGLVFARRGLTLESCSSFFLPRLVGLSRAMFLATTAGVYPPQERYFGNLFTEVISEAAQVLPRALELAMEMAEAVSPTASTMNRALLWQGAASPEEAHLLESRVFHAMITSR